MTIRVDAHISSAITRWLAEQLAIDARHLGTLNLLGADDSVIFAAARAACATILTKDSDFLDLVQRQGPPPCIIWITCGNTSNAALIRILHRAIRQACELVESGEPVVEIGD